MFDTVEDSFTITYHFKFKDKDVKQFNVLIDKQTLCLNTEIKSTPPVWVQLDCHKCPICPLSEGLNKYCPIALNLCDLAEEFKEFHAYEKVNVTIVTNERTYSKDTTIQEGLGSLIGIIMASSGCPVMDYLRPMVRFHLPFASLEETVFRMVSMYIMAQYILERNGRYPDKKLAGLEEIYFNVGQVNKHIAKRLAEVSGKDANINALSTLDCFASLVPLEVEDMLKSVESSLYAYLK